MTATRHDGSRLHWMEPVTAGRSAGDFAERTLGATRGVALATAWPAAFASWVVLRPLGCCPPLTVPAANAATRACRAMLLTALDSHGWSGGSARQRCRRAGCRCARPRRGGGAGSWWSPRRSSGAWLSAAGSAPTSLAARQSTRINQPRSDQLDTAIADATRVGGNRRVGGGVLLA
jgi:hypothetical protein